MVSKVRITVLVEGGDCPGLKGSSASSKMRPLVGLSLFVEVTRNNGTHRILMDTGSRWQRLEHNAAALGKDLDEIDCGFISHWHFDHVGALPALWKQMKSRPPFYVPTRGPSFSPINAFTELRLPSDFNRVEVTGPCEVLPEVFSTGCLEADFPLQKHKVHEQALYTKAEGHGLVLLVGCCHPRPQDLAKRAMELSGEDRIALMLGGFHFIPPTKEPQKQEIIQELLAMKIERIGPCHCTGAEGMDRFAEEFGDRFVRVKLGGAYEVGA